MPKWFFNKIISNVFTDHNILFIPNIFLLLLFVIKKTLNVHNEPHTKWEQKRQTMTHKHKTIRYMPCCISNKINWIRVDTSQHFFLSLSLSLFSFSFSPWAPMVESSSSSSSYFFSFVRNGSIFDILTWVNTRCACHIWWWRQIHVVLCLYLSLFSSSSPICFYGTYSQHVHITTR